MNVLRIDGIIRINIELSWGIALKYGITWIYMFCCVLKTVSMVLILPSVVSVKGEG